MGIVTALIHVVAGLGLFLVATSLWRARTHLAETTLTAGWYAAAIAFATWSGVWWLTRWTDSIPISLHTHLWFAVGVTALCPLVAVLGARRPVSRAWPWFVLLPLVLVFAVPSVTTLWRYGAAAALQVETPMLVGFLLVLVMGAGNYLGTRFTAATLLYATAVCCVAAPATNLAALSPWSLEELTDAGTIGFGLSFLAASRAARRTISELPNYDRLWIDFRDTFGIVWAKRVMERVNWTAREEKWPAHLDFTGLVWTKKDLTDEERRHVVDRLTHTYRWLLKRFTNDRWIDSRLQ